MRVRLSMSDNGLLRQLFRLRRIQLLALMLISLFVAAVGEQWFSTRHQTEHDAGQLQELASQLNERTFNRLSDDLNGLGSMSFIQGNVRVRDLQPGQYRSAGRCKDHWRCVKKANWFYLLNLEGTVVASTPYDGAEPSPATVTRFAHTSHRSSKTQAVFLSGTRRDYR